MNHNAVDLFSGCGGLTEGLRQAGFNVIAGIELDTYAATTYRLNHPRTILFEEDIRNFNCSKITDILNGEKLHLLAGCPPCQGFSSIRRLNRNLPVEDLRNDLVFEYLRFVEELNPLTIMMENVPALEKYSSFIKVVNKLEKNYMIDYKTVNVANYGVPQRRKRLVLVDQFLCNEL